MNVSKLTTKADFVAYWRECIDLLPRISDRVVAGYIANVAASDHFQKWYQEGAGDQGFVELFNLASTLEMPNSIGEVADDADREARWAKLRDILIRLEIRHS